MAHLPRDDARDAAIATDETLAPRGDDPSTDETMAPPTPAAGVRSPDFATEETLAPPSGDGSPLMASGPGNTGPVELPAGTRAGEYVVEGLLGEGGFGRVYRGVHPVIGKPVAIKVLHLRYSADPAIVSRFVAEARAVNQIGHDGIIDIFAFGTLPDGRHYYVMELLEGITLRGLIAERGRIGLDEALPILREMAAALDAAHAAGVAHRDFKPDNIFLTPRGAGWRVKLLDFGVAKLMMQDAEVGHRTATGASVGTPAYMAPEQVIGKAVDHRADIYAFGVVAFHMLSGRLPFAADSAFSVMTAHVNEPPPDLSTLVGDLPAAATEAVRWALAKAPEARPPDLAAFVARLEGDRAARAASGVVAAPMPTIDAPAASGGGGRWALVAVLAVAAAGGAWWWVKGVAEVAGEGAGAAASAGEAPAGEATVTAAPVEPAAAPVAARDAAVAPDAAVAGEVADAAPPPLPATVQLRFDGAPDGTEIRDAGGALLATTPAPVVLPRGEARVTLTLRAEGHAEATVEVAPSADRVVAVALAELPRPAPTKRPPRPAPTPGTTPATPSGGADALEPF
ncbi:MAG: serine/threonine protein kinase [Myxococcales bacterium]|nr:serine/threonine protein kinase [Myxococcales bacterium]